MDSIKLCKDVLVNVNKIVTKRCDEQRYIKFSKKLDKRLRCKYGKYYICDQVNQDKNKSNVFYIVAFYRNIPGVYKVSLEASQMVEDAYYYEFGNCIERTSILTFRDVKKVYPNCKDNEDDKCNECCDSEKED